MFTVFHSVQNLMVWWSHIMAKWLNDFAPRLSVCQVDINKFVSEFGVFFSSAFSYRLDCWYFGNNKLFVCISQLFIIELICKVKWAKVPTVYLFFSLSNSFGFVSIQRIFILNLLCLHLIRYVWWKWSVIFNNSIIVCLESFNFLHQLNAHTGTPATATHTAWNKRQSIVMTKISRAHF